MKVKVNPTSDSDFHKIWNVIGDICDRMYCHKGLFYVANKFLCFNLSQCLCTRNHDIQ